MKRPLALDLFCCAGGATKGLQRAGFHVTGVDIRPQPRYCGDAFVQGDALNPPFDLRQFDFIWASPTCQKHTAMKSMHNAKEHIDLIPPTRAMLQAAGVPYAIENVPGAPLINPVTLCGTMFNLGISSADLRRHRGFETSFPLTARKCQHSKRATIGLYGGHIRNRIRREGSHARGLEDFTFEEGCQAMVIDWMTTAEMSQAIPPAYSEFIGKAAIAHARRPSDLPEIVAEMEGR